MREMQGEELQMKTIVWPVACTAVLMTAPAFAAEPAFPNKPIRMVTGSAPGGGSDTVARTLSEKLNERFGQPVLVDNRAGAGGTIGADIVAKAQPDGYTWLVATSSSMVVNPAMQKLPYDVERDLAPVMQISTVPFILVVNPQVAAKSISELIALAKARPGKLSYATSGIGSMAHLAMEQFKYMAGVNLVHVPYRGSAPAAFDLIGGQVQVAFNNLIPTLPHVKSGRLRALGVSSLARASALPDVPTVAESGLPGFEAMQWYGVLLPGGVPKTMPGFIYRELTAVMQMPAVRARLMEEGGEVIGNTPEQFGRIISAELAKWTKLVKAAKIRAE
jgi:tripartite-type tricarboxylate transporter receptor subunit TctC